MRKEYLIYNYGSAGEEGGEEQKSDRLTASNGKRHGNGSGRGNKADQRPKRVSHNGSHHLAAAASDSPTANNDNMPVLDEIDCLPAFHAVYHELQLIRTVRRPRDLLAEPIQQKASKVKKSHESLQTFLFLGNIHPQLEQRASYRPTSYQPALVRHDHHEVSE